MFVLFVLFGGMCCVWWVDLCLVGCFFVWWDVFCLVGCCLLVGWFVGECCWSVCFLFYVFVLLDWWDVPIGCIGCLIGGVSLLGGICMVRCFVLLSDVFVLLCVFFLFGGIPCPAVVCCLCGLLFVVGCICSLAVSLFVCMFVLFWL